MTLEELLNANADSLDKLKPEELTEYFSKFFPTTRPELARKSVNENSAGSKRERSQLSLPSFSNEQKEHLAKLAALGISLDFAQHPVRKKR